MIFGFFCRGRRDDLFHLAASTMSWVVSNATRVMTILTLLFGGICLSKEELERQRWKICADNWHWFLYFCAIYFLRIDSLKIWQEIPMAAYFNDVNKTKPSIEEVTARTFVLWHEQDGKEELRKVYENSIYPYYNKQTRMMQEYACFFFTCFIWWL